MSSQEKIFGIISYDKKITAEGIKCLRVNILGYLKPFHFTEIARIVRKYGAKFSLTYRSGIDFFINRTEVEFAIKDLRNCGIDIKWLGGAKIIHCGSVGGICRYSIGNPIPISLRMYEMLVEAQEQVNEQDFPEEIEFTVSGCANMCTLARIIDFTVVITKQPETDFSHPCTECMLCVRACRDDAIWVENCTVTIDRKRCYRCALCIRTCREKHLIGKETYDVWIGGAYLRYDITHFSDLYLKNASLNEVIDLAGKVGSFYRREGKRGERLYHTIERIGKDVFEDKIGCNIIKEITGKHASFEYYANKKAMHSVRPQVNAETCIGCGECVEACPNEVLALQDDIAVVVKPQMCEGLARCVKVCPAGAIRFPLTRKLFEKSSIGK